MIDNLLCIGKRIDNGEFVCGHYAKVHNINGNVSHRIYTGYSEPDDPEWWEIDPDTITYERTIDK